MRLEWHDEPSVVLVPTSGLELQRQTDSKPSERYGYGTLAMNLIDLRTRHSLVFCLLNVYPKKHGVPSGPQHKEASARAVIREGSGHSDQMHKRAGGVASR